MEFDKEEIKVKLQEKMLQEVSKQNNSNLDLSAIEFFSFLEELSKLLELVKQENASNLSLVTGYLKEIREKLQTQNDKMEIEHSNDAVNKKENIDNKAEALLDVVDNSFTNDKEETIILKKSHDWRAMVYGREGWYTNFSSMQSKLVMVDTEPHKLQIFRLESGNYLVNYTPSEFVRDLRDGLPARGAAPSNYLSLIFKPDELHRWIPDFDETLINGKKMIEEIDLANTNMKYTNLSPMELKFSSKTAPVSEDDILFAKIIVDYYCHKSFSLRDLFSSSSMDQQVFFSLNIVPQNPERRIQKFLKLAQIFENCEIPFAINASRNAREEKSLINAKYFLSEDEYKSAAYSKGKIETFKPKTPRNLEDCALLINTSSNAEGLVLKLDDNGSLCSEANLKAFYNHLLSLQTIENMQAVVDKVETRIAKIPGYKRKDGLPDDDHDRENKRKWIEREKESIRTYKKILDTYLPVRDDTISILESFYEYKFGKSIKSDGLESKMNSQPKFNL